MVELTPSAPTPTTPSGNKPFFTIPVAIVIAGALIAGAVYLSNLRATLPPTQSQAVPAEEKPIEVGNIRAIGGNDHIRGSAEARVSVIEYSDLECPFCKQFHSSMQQLLAEHPNDVRWVYRHLPLERLHSKAKQEAIATECAGEQGKFWEMTDRIYEVTPSNNGLNLDDLPKLAEQAGVSNGAQFQACLSSNKYAARVEEDLKDAEEAGALNFGTPYSVIIDGEGNKTSFPGAQPYADLKRAVESVL